MMREVVVTRSPLGSEAMATTVYRSPLGPTSIVVWEAQARGAVHLHAFDVDCTINTSVLLDYVEKDITKNRKGNPQCAPCAMNPALRR